MSMPAAITEAVVAIQSGEKLSTEQAEAAIAAVLDPAATEVDIACLLTALSMQETTSHVLAGAARALRSRAVRIQPQSSPLLDTCGTGGTGLSTLNISTATAIVAAACGIAVAKHGNRGATSRSGSADVLETLGVQLEMPPERVAACIDAVGIGFLYARTLHPAMKAVAPTRTRLPFRTLFNLIGPLSNPAGATHQLLGTGRHEAAVRMAHAAKILGTERTVVVCGDGVLDEVTLSGPTLWHRVEGDEVESGQWLPADFGLDPVAVDDLMIETPQQSADLIGRIFVGDDLPAARVVLANAAAALWTVGAVANVGEGVAVAAAAIADGRVAAKRDELVAFTREAASS